MLPRVPFYDLAAMTGEVRAEVDHAWAALLAAGDFVGGAAVERFEEQWARYCGTAEAVAVANGTDSLVLILRALGIGPGDEVVLPTNTFVATAEAVVLAGVTPRFADVDPDTLLLSPDTLRPAIGPRTAAVIAVHLYGQPADMDGIGEVAARAGLVVLEDAAQAHGASWWGRPAGSLSRAGSFSFYPGKNLGAFGDAGAVVTSDPELAGTLRSLRNHGRQAGSHYVHDRVGTNSRLDTIQAAVLSAKLPLLDRWTAARRAIVERYRDAVEGGPLRLVGTAPGAEHAYHLAVALVPDREAVRAALDRLGVATAVHYPVPCHRQDPYRRFADGPLPVAEEAAGRLLSLPLFPHLTAAQVDQVCGALREVSRLGADTGAMAEGTAVAGG
jgi:dTDP-4-amino-4,6-dideoxygalactose transaminase